MSAIRHGLVADVEPEWPICYAIGCQWACPRGSPKRLLDSAVRAHKIVTSFSGHPKGWALV
jgi:hypothetical protein